jgi:hypothetical protein
MKLPSKKYLVGFFIIAALAAGGLFITLFYSSEITVGNDSLAASVTLGEDETESLTKDSDTDGLPDWQEDIYDTDSTNPDTDGDGFTDGNEVANGYDPLHKGDGKGSDKLVAVRKIEPRARPVYLDENIEANMISGIAASTPQEVVALDNDSMELLVNLMTVFSDEQNATAAFKGTAIQTGEASSTAIRDLLDPPLPKAVIAGKEETQEARVKYVEDVKKIVSELNQRIASGGDLMLTIPNIFSDVPPVAEKAMRELDGVIASYDNAVDQLLIIQPPPSFYQFHLKYAKNLESTSVFFFTLQTYKTDRIKSALYLEMLSYIMDIAEKITSEFVQLAKIYNLSL